MVYKIKKVVHIFFLIGIVSTFIMLSLLPNTSFGRNRIITTLFMFVYSSLYFFIIQYGLTVDSSFKIPLFFVALILILYLSTVDRYINLKLDLDMLFKIVLFIMIPIVLCFSFPTANNQFHLIDILIITFVFGINQSRFSKATMLYQENTIEFYGSSTTAHLLILFIFLGYRKININPFFINKIDAWGLTLVVTFLCCFFAILIGVKLNYLSFNFKKAKTKTLLILTIFNFFHIAIAEEIIYRGFVYNYLRQFIGGGDWIPLVLTTLLFGCHHISFGGKRMFVLSSIAGFFYGLIYMLTGSLLTSAIIHTITNIVWRLFIAIKSDESSVVRFNVEAQK